MLNISKAVNLILLCAFVLITGSCCQRTDDANKLTASGPAVKSQPISTLTPVTTSTEDLKQPYIQLSYLNQPILKPDKRICQPLTKKNLNEKLMLDTAGGGKEYKSEFISANGKSLSQAALEQEVVQRKTRKFFIAEKQLRLKNVCCRRSSWVFLFKVRRNGTSCCLCLNNLLICRQKLSCLCRSILLIGKNCRIHWHMLYTLFPELRRKEIVYTLGLLCRRHIKLKLKIRPIMSSSRAIWLFPTNWRQSNVIKILIMVIIRAA